MMRRILSLVLISLFVIQPASVFAQEPAANRTTQEILADMPQEVSRFSRSHPLEVATRQNQPKSGENQADSPDRIREKVLATPIGTPVTVSLRNGEVVFGELAEVSESHFFLRFPVPDRDNVTAKRKYNYGVVSNIQADSRARLAQIPIGKTVELLLVGGDKYRGRLNAVSDVGVTVDDRQFAIDEIVHAYKAGMRTSTKLLIAAGIAAVLFGLASYASARAL